MKPCTREWKLSVIASRVHIVGQGAARLVKGDEALAGGRGRAIELAGAQVRSYDGAWGRVEHPLTSPVRIEPFGLLPDGDEYEVTYQAGAVIDVTASRSVPDGHYVGPGILPACESGRGCAIVWPEDGRVLRFERAVAETVELTGEFPFGQLAVEGDKRGRVSRVDVHVTTGKLTCGEEEVSLDDLDVTATSVRLIRPIKLAGNTFSLSAEGGPPGQVVADAAAAPIPMIVVGAIAFVALAAAIVAWRVLGRRRRRTSQAAASTSPSWLVEVPLAFDRPETREALMTLTDAYADPAAARALAEDAGVSAAYVNFAQAPVHVMRDLMKQAAAEQKLARLLRVAMDDPAIAAYRDRLAKLAGDGEADRGEVPT